MIIHDAADLKFGAVKLKIGGSSGQNGVKDIVKRLGSTNFPRMKLGIGQPERQGTDLGNWVLGRFRSTDASTISDMLSTAQKCASTYVKEGVDRAMNEFNGGAKTSKKAPKKSSSSAESSSSLDKLAESADRQDIQTVPMSSPIVVQEG